MKYFLCLLSLISTLTFANDEFDQKAKDVVQEFIFSVNHNSGGINVKSNWDNLLKKIKPFATEEAISSIYDASSDESFNQSLLYSMRISASAITLAQLTDGPKITDRQQSEKGSIYVIKPYDSKDIETYYVLCSKIEVKGWFGKSKKASCKINEVKF